MFLVPGVLGALGPGPQGVWSHSIVGQGQLPAERVDAGSKGVLVTLVLTLVQGLRKDLQQAGQRMLACTMIVDYA